MTDTLERDVGARPPRPPRRRRSRWRSMLFVALLVSLGLIAAGVLPLQQYLERENQVNEARDRLAAIVDENDRLADEASALLSDQEIERIAREQYGFVQPGEVGYVVITPDEAPMDVRTEPAPAAPTADDRGFLQRIWDFITGGDTAPDG